MTNWFPADEYAELAADRAARQLDDAASAASMARAEIRHRRRQMGRRSLFEESHEATDGAQRRKFVGAMPNPDAKLSGVSEPTGRERAVLRAAEGLPTMPYDPTRPGQCSRLEPGSTPIPVALSVDYGVPELPLWGDWPGDTPLPDDLRERLAAWQQEFEEGYLPDSGWRSDSARDRWLSKADGLADELRALLAGRAELTVDLWPIDGDR